MSERDDQPLIVADTVDDPAGEHIDLAAPHDGEAIPTRKFGPGIGIPLDVIDRLGDLNVELIAETGSVVAA